MMQLREETAAARARWEPLTLYQKFEDVVVLILTGLIAIVIVSAVWNLALKVLFGLILSDTFDPTEHAVFQAVFGMIFTVIIALEFKRSLLVVTERRGTVVQVSGGHSDRDARDHPKVDHPGSCNNQCAPVVRACRSDFGARRGILARSRSRPTRAHLVGCQAVCQQRGRREWMIISPDRLPALPPRRPGPARPRGELREQKRPLSAE
jgi:Phosphate-starvation-inducible E family